MVDQQQQQEEKHNGDSSSIMTSKNDGFSNNIVAQSDYQVALDAIESTFDDFLSHNDADSDDTTIDRERVAEIYRAAKQSMIQNLKRIVVPIPDNDFHDYVDQYHFLLEDDSEDDEDNAKSCSDVAEEDDDDAEEEEEIDLEELIDAKNWEYARNLRVRTRSMACAVQAIRDRVLKCSEEGVSSSLSAHLSEPQIKISEEEFQKDFAENGDPTTTLEESLKGLSKILQDPQWSLLPNRIQSLQDNVEAIEKEIAEDRPMSQTEAAILSRNNENGTNFLESTRKLLGDSTDDNIDIPALDRLAMFGQYCS